MDNIQNSKQWLIDYFNLYRKFDYNDQLDKLIELKELWEKANSTNKKVIFCGNGGSAAMASHCAVDLTKNAGVKAINFNEADLITCFANDFGYEHWISNALKFYASVRIEVRRSAQIKQGDKVVGNRVKAKIVKNKVAPPFQRCEFDIMYNEGISIAGDLLEIGTQYNVITKRGNTYSYQEQKLGVGRENVKNFFREHKKLMMEIRGKVKEAVQNNV